jgi:hypothetical protein
LFGNYWGKEDPMLDELEDMIKQVEQQEENFYQDI